MRRYLTAVWVYCGFNQHFINICATKRLKISNKDCCRSFMDLKRPGPLSGTDEGSYAYLTIRNRMPVILTKVIDVVHQKASAYTRENQQEYAQDANNLVAKLSKMNYELKTNKKLTPIEDSKDDVEIWNDFLRTSLSLVECGSEITWFSGAWLTSECYMYRKIYEAFALSKHHQTCDPYQEQKQASFMSQQENMTSLAKLLEASITNLNAETSLSKKQEAFETFLQFSVWGNRCDLSISSGEVLATYTAGLASKLDHMREHILVNNTDQVWQLLQTKDNHRVDFILDNAGFELFTDLCLAEYLLCSNTATVIYLHLKDIPWFVSDTTESDFFWTLNQLKDCSNEALSHLGYKWLQRIENGSFVLRKHWYWTLCSDFSEMKATAGDLFGDLSQSKFLFFKGDLNYRKLVGDRKWPYTTPFEMALWGFSPAPLCALRTIKAEVVVGLEEGKYEAVEAVDKDWMITGSYAVIQCSPLT